MRLRTPGFTALGAALLLAGCQFLSAPPPIRYFSVEPFPGPAERMGGEHEEPLSLRLRRVSAASHLRERIVWRTSDVESGFYELRRWTESPANYLSRALSRELFEVRGLQPSESTRDPSLDIELLAFEEVIGSARQARVEVVVRLYDARSKGLLERTITETRRLEGEDPAELARAISLALRMAVEETANSVEERLSSGGGPATPR